MRQCHGSPWTQRKPRCLGSRAVWGQGLAIVSLWLPGPEAWLPRGNHLPWEFPEIFAACLWWYLHPVAAVVGVGPEDKDVNFDKREWLRPDRTSQHVYASWERNSPPAPPGAGDRGRRKTWHLEEHGRGCPWEVSEMALPQANQRPATVFYAQPGRDPHRSLLGSWAPHALVPIDDGGPTSLRGRGAPMMMMHVCLAPPPERDACILEPSPGREGGIVSQWQ